MTESKIITSISYSQDEILQNILKLCKLRRFSLDPTYGHGCFYKKILQPRYKSDVNPKLEDIQKSDCCGLPFKENSLKSIMFDPPFTGGSRRKNLTGGIIKTRFGYYKNLKILWEFYRKALEEFHRILTSGGFLVVKCQDVVECRKNWFSHIQIYNDATEIGFEAIDLFILLAKQRMPQWNLKNQEHARKYHSYFWIFQKK